jgi:hypothetical protein
MARSDRDVAESAIFCTIRRNSRLGDIMLNWRNGKIAGIAVLAAMLGAGCSSSGSKNSPPPEGLLADSTDNDLLDIGPPQMRIEKGVLIITGTVTRKPGVHDVIAGRIDVDIFASNGDELAWLPCLLTPDPVPDDQTSQSTYEVHYGLVPPGGSTVQVHFVDKATAVQEDVDDREYGYGGGGGGGGGQMGHPGGHGNGGGHHGHMGW